MRTVNGLHVLLVSAILCGLVQTAAAQSSAKDEVLAAFAERDKVFVAVDETKVAQIMSEDYLQTDISGHVQDKLAWLSEYFRPMAPLLRSGETRLTTFDRTDTVVRDFGDTVVVAGKLSLKFAGVDPGNPKVAFQPGPPRVIRFTAVWVKRGGVWKLVVLHNAIPQEHHDPPPTDRKEQRLDFGVDLSSCRPVHPSIEMQNDTLGIVRTDGRKLFPNKIGEELPVTRALDASEVGWTLDSASQGS